MQVVAKTNDVRISPRKVRLVADTVRNMPPNQALNKLMLVRKRAAIILAKTIKSAISNATNNAKLSEDGLRIVKMEVNEGPFLKRYRIGSRSRVKGYKKRSSHITVVLEDKGGKSSL